MSEVIMSRTLIISALCMLVSGLSGCSILGKKPAANTPAAAEETAYTLCGGCHGPVNVRVNFMAATLRDYRDRKRIEPFMNGVAANLTDQDIDNLATYFSNYGQHKN
jgi:cytochrome c553